MSNGHSGIVFRVFCKKNSTGRERLAPIDWHNWHVFASLMAITNADATIRKKMSECTHIPCKLQGLGRTDAFSLRLPLCNSHKIEVLIKQNYWMKIYVLNTLNVVSAEKEITACEITKHLRTLGLLQS